MNVVWRHQWENNEDKPKTEEKKKIFCFLNDESFTSFPDRHDLVFRIY